MKKNFLAFVFIFVVLHIAAQDKPFRFAFISDTHIGSPNGAAEEDLRRTVRDINLMKDVAFVVLTGDITELGTNEELKLAKTILDSLTIPWYIIPGNHDTGWSESGGLMFSMIFGDDKFKFEYNGILFIGCASGPYVRMSDGHVPRNAINWLDTVLKNTPPVQPIIFLNHYPIDNGLDNWYEITDRLQTRNTWAILCGHGHANRKMDFEGIQGVMGRSNLRAKASYGGYNLVDVHKDSIFFSERKPVIENAQRWTAIKAAATATDVQKQYVRPDYTINNLHKWNLQWSFSSDANIISTPAIKGDHIIVGNQNGEIVSLSATRQKKNWSFKTGGPIYSSPAEAHNKVVVGSCDGVIYCLDSKNGKVIWKKQTGAPIMGSPLINKDTVFIGGSGHSYYALDLKNGKVIWEYKELNGPVVSMPLLYEGKLIFGAWDKNLYALNSSNGELKWKWTNGSPVMNYSPASCYPVAADGIVFIVAPDRYITAIDANTGATLWRNNDAGVRESLGISSDGKWIYVKSMQDSIAAYAVSREKQMASWKMHCGFGYEHVPSMLIEKEGYVFFGTKNGVVYCINPATKQITWRYKIDNSMVNTVNVMDKYTVVASTMDGKVVKIKAAANY